MAWGGRGGYYGGWAPYVPVAERRRKAMAKVAALAKKGEKVAPINIVGRTIATTFWGKAWCENLESYMDYANRLPRGRIYVRNGSVVDLKVLPGKVKALVSGSSMYTVEVTIKPLESLHWQNIIKNCAGKIDSLVELLQGKLSNAVMEAVTAKVTGLFPEPKHISLKCSCPDSATMCKHVAAALYGVGSRLDNEPELLFLLRQVDHVELITKASVPAKLDKTTVEERKTLATTDLGTMFGIEIDAGEPAAVAKLTARPKTTRYARKAAPRKVAAVKKKTKGKKKTEGKKKTKGKKKTRGKKRRGAVSRPPRNELRQP